MCRRRAPRPKSWSRSTTTRTARSSSRPIWRSGPTGPSEFPVTFFHLGRYFQKPVRMHVVENGQAREIIYDNAYFDMPADSPAHKLPDNSGFAGFRFQEARNGKLDWRKNDWVAFLGASYFRAIGELYQYGLSARGLAVDVAVFGKSEEFPDFTHVYFETPQPGSDTVTVYALLDGPSVAGRLPFRHAAGESRHHGYRQHDLHAPGRQPPRHRAADLHVLVFGEVEGHRHRLAAGDPRFRRPGHVDRRRRAHLAPAQQPAADHAPRRSADNNPKGFGLLQRDRNFDHYLDGVYYDRRPSLWIEPQGNWGEGAIQLVEIPTDDEIHDNIVAMWVPAEPARAGKALRRSRTACTGRPTSPIPTPLARVVATRFGNGGQAGTVAAEGRAQVHGGVHGRAADPPAQGRHPAARAHGLARRVLQHPDRGRARRRARPLAHPVRPHRRPGPSRSRCAATCAQGDEVLSETWLYQYHPIA